MPDQKPAEKTPDLGPNNPQIREALKRRAKERVKSARWNGNILMLAFAIFAATAVLAIQARETPLVAGFAVVGLGILWLFSARQAKTLEKESMDDEVAFYNSLLAVEPARQEAQAEPTERTGSTESPLSDRELEVLRQVAQGHTNKEVALALSISEQTVKNHLRHIYTKLEVNDRTSAIMVASRNGLMSK